MKAHLEKLRADAAECGVNPRSGDWQQKRALFTRLAEHHATLASEVEAAIAAKRIGGE